MHTCHLRFSLRAVLLFALCGGCGWSHSLAIRRVTVIDATGRSPAPDMTVVVDQDRIVAVGPWRKTRIPKNAVVVDGAGKFLIPDCGTCTRTARRTRTPPGPTFFFLANGVSVTAKPVS